MPTSTNITKSTRKVLLISAIFAVGGVFAVQAQKTVPDSQVESNVLKALAGAPELASESITTHTLYGAVTLSGSVRDEQARRKAEDLAANAEGVTKVVDELRILTSETATQLPPSPQQVQGDGTARVLQSDGTYAPAPTSEPEPAAPVVQRNDPEPDQELDRQRQSQAGNQPPSRENNPQANEPYEANSGLPPLSRRPQDPYPQNRPAPTPPINDPQQPPYSPNNYPQQSRYPQNGYTRGGYRQQPVYGGQASGQSVTIPSGALVRVRMNRTLSSDHSQPGSTFDAIVTNDVVADGFIAVPRGATVQGTVIEAKSSGILKGRGEMSIQLTHVTLGGRVYPLVSNVCAFHGGDKTIETVNRTAGFGAAGAVIGAIAGGGVGAAVGGGIGALAGMGSSAASGNGQVYIPTEGMMSFHLAQPAAVETVSEGEMQRLAFGTIPGGERPIVRRRAYPPVVLGPGYPVYYSDPYRHYSPYGPYGYPRY
jgi:hypothetical protein